MEVPLINQHQYIHMEYIGNYIAVLVLSIAFFSCSNGTPSLQEYFVSQNQNSNFISIDIPSSILSVDNTLLSDQQKQAFESVKKLNVLAFRLNQENSLEYEKEKQTISEILKDDKYQDLMVMNSGIHRGTIKYLGTDEAIDEVIIFGSSDDEGLALIRVLGKDMKPENMITLVKALENGSIDVSGLEGQLKGVFDK
ncbi:hypothetical protein I215_03033 [Galbibacter marinus]|uniref:DUF4252 domain-containing protein n=2 Tax=Galbibacter marinus TaxID=555500 RepID=K2P618_9FLAO|nr:hypothetical protein I215_03033 [Galbibacter marinus]